ncbi:MAG: hypothetical protein ACLTHY_09745 [[Ruminococcus] torques]
MDVEEIYQVGARNIWYYKCYGRTETGSLTNRRGGQRMENKETMNLQQKLIAISNEMPKLLKKHYSDEVDYDFVKIDDILNC